MESGCGYPELRPLCFGIIKRETSLPLCQHTLKRACQATGPNGTHISYSQSFLLGEGLEGKQEYSHPEATRSTQAVRWVR